MKSYDVFKRDSGGPSWLESRETLEEAKNVVVKLLAAFPDGSFFIYDPSQNKVVHEVRNGPDGA